MTEAANTHIRTPLLNAPPTQGVQGAGIGTTTTLGYAIRFKSKRRLTRPAATLDGRDGSYKWMQG
ncbi:hypothetical protein ASPWEDRAFT_38646 [Aspergillus wentii DTO 134E9]|uniref:Uncharacterized protein n=1 Tax=Aspergillus wentii DTO 134E9 TaxID=1073089 RepID=A0A1L9RPX6_ASPWE|nr:uncharacterized protein ASPWEDRAFT_38646 [Aspergillus wentii DTO 134E9]OJJ37010.1 hypothetical protein ASPWEDRAFT_38646 [Aspergillus wentii DTO 134E9]